MFLKMMLELQFYICQSAGVRLQRRTFEPSPPRGARPLITANDTMIGGRPHSVKHLVRGKK